MQILTKWHRFLEAYQKTDVNIEIHKNKSIHVARLDSFDPVKCTGLLAMMNAVPKFYMDDTVCDLLRDQNDEIIASLVAMDQAGCLELPYNKILVEVNHDVRTYFVFLQRVRAEFPERLEKELPPGIRHRFLANVMFHTVKNGKEWAILQPVETLVDFFSKMPEHFNEGTVFTEVEQTDVGQPGVHYACLTAPYITNDNDDDLFRNPDPDIEQDFGLRAAGTALLAALVLLNTRGIAREMIKPPEKLNKARKKSKKPLIPEISIIRIGHYYNEKGEAIKLAPGERKPPRVHFRRGHTRNQRYGPGLKDSRVVYIEPTIVNYRGEAPAAPQYRIAK